MHLHSEAEVLSVKLNLIIKLPISLHILLLWLCPHYSIEGYDNCNSTNDAAKTQIWGTLVPCLQSREREGREHMFLRVAYHQGRWHSWMQQWWCWRAWTWLRMHVFTPKVITFPHTAYKERKKYWDCSTSNQKVFWISVQVTSTHRIDDWDKLNSRP